MLSNVLKKTPNNSKKDYSIVWAYGMCKDSLIVASVSDLYYNSTQLI